jgi:hypothetical protein
MTRYTIRTVGNPALYRSIQESLATETHHRTTSGAARRLMEIVRQSRRWTANVGNWGNVEIEINGQTLSDDDAYWVFCQATEELNDPITFANDTKRALERAQAEPLVAS